MRDQRESTSGPRPSYPAVRQSDSVFPLLPCLLQDGEGLNRAQRKRKILRISARGRRQGVEGVSERCRQLSTSRQEEEEGDGK